MARIRVLLADDHAVLRAGLRLLINAQPDMEVVGEAANTTEARELARALAPDVLTLDLTMPGGSSVQLIERLRQEQPQTRVLVLTMHDDTAYLRAVLAAGGAGYLVKTAADAELLSAIRSVWRGRIFVDVDLNKGTPPAPLGGPAGAGAAAVPGLSSREREVLTLLAQGHTNQEIAGRLFLSVKTIETYRGRIAEKLGLRTRAELYRYALETGLLGRAETGPETPAD
jgi:two-component system, NarL family, response regulator NreC